VLQERDNLFEQNKELLSEKVCLQTAICTVIYYRFDCFMIHGQVNDTWTSKYLVLTVLGSVYASGAERDDCPRKSG